MKLAMLIMLVLVIGAVHGQFCVRNFQNWQNIPVDLDPRPAPGGGTNHYYDCQVPRPGSSVCTGNCGTSSVTFDTIAELENVNCECCHPDSYLEVCFAFCWVVTVNNNNCITDIDYRVVSCTEHPDLQPLSYRIVDDCNCGPCDPFARRKKRQAADGGRRGNAEPIDPSTLDGFRVPEPDKDQATIQASSRFPICQRVPTRI